MHTVLMPFNRPENFEVLYEHLAGQGVAWRLLCDDASKLPAWPPGATDWVKAWTIKPPIPRSKRHDNDLNGPPTYNPGHWAVDKFLDWALEREPDFFSTDNWVSFQTDDCLWSWNYYRKLRRCWGDHLTTKPRVVIGATMHRGGVVAAVHNRQPGRPAWEDDTARCFVTRFEALSCRADLLKDKRLGRLWCADGLLVERLCAENAGAVACFNEGLVYWNALDPRAWGFSADHQPEQCK